MSKEYPHRRVDREACQFDQLDLFGTPATAFGHSAMEEENAEPPDLKSRIDRKCTLLMIGIIKCPH